MVAFNAGDSFVLHLGREVTSTEEDTPDVCHATPGDTAAYAYAVMWSPPWYNSSFRNGILHLRGRKYIRLQA